MSFKTEFKYNGDPLTEVELTFGGEFAAANPDRFIQVGSFDGGVRIPVEEVICDSCNARVARVEPCAMVHARLYCWACYLEWIFPFLVDVDGQQLPVGSCPACKGKGVGVFTPPHELTFSGQCSLCGGLGK